MIITSKLKLNLQQPGSTPIIPAAQTDCYCRNLEIALYNGNAPFSLPSDCRAIVRFRKIDGKGGEYDALPDGTPAWICRRNVLTVALAPQMLTMPGSVMMSITILADNMQVTLPPVQIQVEAVYHSEIAKSQDYFYVLTPLPAPENAKTGQFFQVKTVNEQGQVTQVEAVYPEIASGSVSPELIQELVEAYLSENPPASGENGVSATHSWNGTTLTITSASGTSSADLKGEKGDAGSDATVTAVSIHTALGYAPASQTDLDEVADQDVLLYRTQALTSAEKAQARANIEAVTQADIDAAVSTVLPEFVDSTDQMTDQNRKYVLSTTGTIWVYGQFTQEAPNLYDPATAKLNTRINSSNQEVALNGKLLLPIVDFEMTNPCYLRVKGIPPVINYGCYANVLFYSSDGTTLGTFAFDGTPGYITDNGDYLYDLYDANYASAEKMQFWISVTASTAITEDDLVDVSISLDNQGCSIDGFYDTGVAWSGGSNSGTVTDLVVQVSRNTSDIAYANQRLSTLESAGSTAAIPSFWEAAVEAAVEKIKALQVGRHCVTFPFFSDNHQRLGYAGALIGKVMEECHIPYCFYGGDSIDSGYIAGEAAMLEQEQAFSTMMSVIPDGRLCRAVGNHDGYWAVSAGEEHCYSREQVYELFLRGESAAQNRQFGGDGTCYYVDDLGSQVRFIVLNSNSIRDSSGSVTESAFDAEQLAWFRDTALNTETGWAVVIISHQPISNHYHAGISNAAEVRTAAVGSGAQIIGWFSGHIHRDRIYTGAAVNTTDDSVGADLGFTQVTITSDHTGVAYEDATMHTVAEDDQSHAIDFVTINRDTRMVHMTRLGIGSDRSYSF